MNRSISSPTPPSSRVPYARHDLHRAVDGDWCADDRPTLAERRASLIAGLAVIATLPVVAMVFERWPDAPRELVAVVALLPLLALVLCAVVWRPPKADVHGGHDA